MVFSTFGSFLKRAAVAALGVSVFFASGGAWAVPSWQCEMTVGGYAGTSTLEDFPLLVRISPSLIDGFSYENCAPGGADISFTLENGTALPHEVDTWNPDGESLVWVKLPSLSGKETKFWFRWNDPQPAANDPTSVWKVNYAGVWHMAETTAGTATLADSAGNMDGASHKNSLVADGVVGKARGRTDTTGKNGATMTVPKGDVLDALTPTFTVSGWFKPTTTSGSWAYLYSRKDADSYPSWGWQIRASGDPTSIGVYSCGNADNDTQRVIYKTDGKFPKNEWRKYDVVYTSSDVTFYLDGVSLGTSAIKPGAAKNGSLDFTLGGLNGGGHGTMQAYFDETRLCKNVLSADWVKAEYDQVTSASFVTAGAAARVSTKAIIVTSSLLPYGTVQPGYGTIDEPVAGQEYVFTCTQTEQLLVEGQTKAACVGWKLRRLSDEELIRSSADAGEAPHVCRHVYAQGVGVDLQWQWVIRHRLAAVAGAGGTVDKPEQWADEGANATVTAVPDEGYEFYAWTGDVPEGQSRDRELTLSLAQARTVRAIFVERIAGSVLYVSTDGSDANDGSSWSKSLLTLSNAVEKATDGTTVRVAGGRYRIDSELVISNGISIVGLKGAADTVIFQKPAGVAQNNATKYGFNMIKIDHADALLQGFTLTGVVIDGTYSVRKGTVMITEKGGTMRDCVISGNKSVTYHIKGIGANVCGGLVDSCVFRDNSEGYGEGAGVVYISGGELRNSLVVENVIQWAAVYVAPNLASPVVIRNCTISRNRPMAGNSSRYGTGIYVDKQEKDANVERLLIENTVMWGNEGNAASDYGYPNWQISTVGKTYLTTNRFFNCCSPVVCGANDSIAAAPLFADAANGDYTVLSSSPLVDAGRTTVSTRDLAGLARPSGAAYDIGAYEYDQNQLSASFAIDKANGFAGDSVTLTPTVFGATSAENLSYAWLAVNVSTGERLTGAERVFSVASPVAGKYDVRLTVTDGGVTPAKTFDYSVASAFVRIAPVMYVNPKSAHAAFPYDTEENAAATLAEANDVALDGSVVRLQPGVHELTVQLIVEAGVSYVGQGEGVIIKQKTDGERVIYMNHPQARFENVAITGGRMGSSGSLGGKYPYSRNQHGCGVRIGNAGGTLYKCVITNNYYREFYAYGGGVGMLGGHVDRCLIANNQLCSGSSDSTDGGGAYVGGGILENCLITGNKVYGKGGGVCINSSSAVVRNCTVYGNESTSANAGGFYYVSGTVLNCAVYGNVSSELANFGPAAAATSANILNCASSEGFGTDAVTCVNPQFTDPDNGDLSLILGSDLADAGLLYEGATDSLDLAGNTRVSGGKIDIGAYELDMSVVRCGISVSPKSEFYLGEKVTLSAIVTGVDDTSKLAYAWTVTSAGGTAVVGEGASFEFEPETCGRLDVELKVAGTPSGEVSAKSEGLLYVVPQVLYANAANADGARFPWNTPATAHTNLNELAAFTIDGCELRLAAGTYAITNVVDVRHVVTIRGAGYKDTVIRYDGSDSRMLYVTRPETLIEGVTFTGSRATHHGTSGHELNRYVAGSVIYLAAATLRNCRVTACTNSTYSTYGIVYAKDGLIERCLIDENYVHADGAYGAEGLVRVEGTSRVRNTVIARNYATRGGGINIGGSDAAVENCTIVGNAADQGGGVYLWQWSTPKVRNCIIWGNTASSATGTTYNNGDIFYGDGANVYPNKVFFNDCTPVEIGNDCLTEDPQIKDVTKGNYGLRSTSPCRKCGLYQDWMEASVDFYGRPRASRGRVDIGAAQAELSGLLLIVR